MSPLANRLLESEGDIPFRTEEEGWVADAITNNPGIAEGLPVEDLLTSKLRTRQEADDAEVVRSYRTGSIDPIIVWRTADGDWIVDGHHRAKARKMVPAYIFDARQPVTRQSAAEQMGCDPSDIISYGAVWPPPQ